MYLGPAPPQSEHNDRMLIVRSSKGGHKSVREVLEASEQRSPGPRVLSRVGAFAGASAPSPIHFVYQLQRIDLEAIGETKFYLVIMDYLRDGSDERKFTAAQIRALKNSPGGPMTVLYYM
jgi:endo-alpha-1,4-polygalactosaminidase (GH114 family)